jgi:hypothetical protein
MSTLSLLPVSMLESLGLGVLQRAVDQALGAGVMDVSDDGSGIHAGLTLSGGQSLNIDGLTANAQGLSGRIYIEGLDSAPLSGTLFDGFTIALTTFDITLAQSGLAASNIGGHLTIPFFTDSSGDPKTVDVEIGIKADGSVAISLAAVESTQGVTSDGLVQLDCELPGGVGSVEIDVASLEVEKSVNGVWTIILSGTLIIETADLSWPAIELRGLGIDTKGHVSLDGGWIDLPNQMALDFYGFHVGLQKLGFGTDASGDKFIGFNGDIHLVEGLPLGGSVQGLVINLATGAVSLAGVGISFEIPDVLEIDGEVEHIQVTANSGTDLSNAGLPASIFNSIHPFGSAGPKKVNVFAGQVKLVIHPADDLEVDAGFIAGNFGGQSVFFLTIDAELPVGIPIFLDVALYGLQGLVATGLDPDPEPDHTWWEWFKYQASNGSGDPNNPGGPDFNKKPDYSATDVNKWLVPRDGAFALGAGATIGTQVDDGFTASAAVMLMLILPGPVISLIGKAKILSKRISGTTTDANFDAMATFDGTAKTFDLTIDAHYQIPLVLEISATAELYVGGGEWFFALGKPPHDKRVKARIFDLFESDAYFVISNSGLITGTWTGYKNSWSFGPLSASIDAYLATLAAIQWSPLQIGGGIELYGNVHLSAFGIGLGITADALLEGCAPDPFYVHGELSVELDLPWPMPDLGATISLTWGGDDGSVPPGPLALSHIDATMIDHADAGGKHGSDHYLLLAHSAQAIAPDLPVKYDPVTPGILNLSDSSLTNWKTRTAAMLPDMLPDTAGLMGPVVPQDAHFTLNFAHSTVDTIGIFEHAKQWDDPTLPKFPKDVEQPVAPPPPNQVGKDDMSNINPDPPSVPFVIKHTLTEVDLYACTVPPPADGTNPWTLIYSAVAKDPPEQEDLSPAIGVTQLWGTWMLGDPTKTDPNQMMKQLKIFPWRLLPGTNLYAKWGAGSQIPVVGKSFSDQNLSFSFASGIETPVIGAPSLGGLMPGLMFPIDGSVKGPVVTIQFPQPTLLMSITAIMYFGQDEFAQFYAPDCFGDGVAMTPASSTQDKTTQAWTLTFSPTGAAIQRLTIPVTGTQFLLYAIDYGSAPVPMAILPDSPALYALKTVTKIEAARQGSDQFQTVENGDPIVEFTYFQTAAGPGTAVGPKLPVTPAIPAGLPPYPALAASCNGQQQPDGAFPAAGALTDLTSYTQWSWPLNGAAAAYYGYDVNVEFVETYVNALYTAFSGGSVELSLHFRCVDRNNNHTLLAPNAIHVPSIPQESALAASEATLALPGYLSDRAGVPSNVGPVERKLLEMRAAEAMNTDVLAEAAVEIGQVPGSVRAQSMDVVRSLSGRVAKLAASQIDPVFANWYLHQLAENAAAEQVKAMWFKPLLPKTRYTLDVVAGPVNSYRGRVSKLGTLGAPGTLSAIVQATDAIGLLTALKAYYAYEDSLTTLERVQFATSRYASFTAQMANATNQLTGVPGATLLRHYVAAEDPLTYFTSAADLLKAFADAGVAYEKDHAALSSFVAGFDPLADDLTADGSAAANGAAALVAMRRLVEQEWVAFSQASSALYDGMITELGHAELVSNQVPVTVPDTEISLLMDATNVWVVGVLLQSPEPLPWQRIWNWIRLTNAAGTLLPLIPMWSVDGSNGLLIPVERGRGPFSLSMTFMGNIGAEAPCITKNGNGVVETAVVGSITMGPRRRFGRPVPTPRPRHPAFTPSQAIKTLIRA